MPVKLGLGGVVSADGFGVEILGRGIGLDVVSAPGVAAFVFGAATFESGIGPGVVFATGVVAFAFGADFWAFFFFGKTGVKLASEISDAADGGGGFGDKEDWEGQGEATRRGELIIEALSHSFVLFSLSTNE